MPSSEQPQRATRRVLLATLVGSAVAAVLLMAIGWWLAGLTPRWYQPVDSSNEAATQLGETAEYRLAEEFQKIRPADQVWRLRIPEDAVNAWLATRLPQWLSGQGVTWPADLSPPQIRITPSGIEVAIASTELGDRIGRLCLRPAISGEALTLPPPTLGVGRLPLRMPFALIHPWIEDAISNVGDLAFLADLLRGEPVAATLPLVDAREIRLHTITCEPRACILEASTSARPGG